MLLASENRLRSSEMIELIKRKGDVLQGELFGLLFLRKEVEKSPRFAFIISTKISKLAVHRNRINRSLHEGVRRNLNIIPNYFNYVFLSKKSAESKSTEEIILSVQEFFKKNRLAIENT